MKPIKISKFDPNIQSPSVPPQTKCVYRTQMDRFLKRRAGGDAAKGNAKRSKHSNDWGAGTPETIVAWNCNGLTARIRSGDGDKIKAFVESVKPDLIFLSEVRVAAANNASSRKPGPNTKWYRGQMKDNDKKSKEDAVGVNSLLRSDQLALYKKYFSLANAKFNLDVDDETEANVHDSDGRVIFVGFNGFSILHTYVPNNGWTESHFARRRTWDEKVEKFIKRQKAANQHIMWIGDLNVAPEDSDLSDPAYYRRQVDKAARRKQGDSSEPIAQRNVGQPGCTDAERERFSSILTKGDLVDVYRHLHSDKVDPEYAYSWRGTVTGMHGGKGMRIDLCVASRPLLPRITEVSITGHGLKREGFMGSDHSPLLIRIANDASADVGETKGV